jgi:hypothetical protein
MTLHPPALPQCVSVLGLAPTEPSPDALLTPALRSLRDSYLLHRRRGFRFVCGLLVVDIRRALDLGARKQAADLLLVLRRLLDESRDETDEPRPHPEAPTPESAVRLVERLAEMRKKSREERPRPQRAAELPSLVPSRPRRGNGGRPGR